MSEFANAALVGGGIAAVVIATSFGRHELSRKAIVRPLVMVGVFAWIYLQGAPTNAAALTLYAVGIGLGVVFALVASAFTQVERDGGTGRAMTVCSVGFVVTWLIALAARLAFVWEADHNQAFRQHLGQFMLDHQLPIGALAPFFLLWAVTMVLGRLAITLLRASALPAATPRPVAVSA